MQNEQAAEAKQIAERQKLEAERLKAQQARAEERAQRRS